MFEEFREKHGSKFGLGPSNDDAPAKSTDRGQDLTTILDRSQRGDLTVLVALITKNMRDAIEQSFHTSDPDDRPNPTPQPTPRDGKPSTSPHADVQIEANSDNYGKEQQAGFGVVRDHRARAGALSFFDDWRDALLLRVGEVVNRDFEGTEEKEQDLQSQDVPIEINERSLDKLRKIYPPVDTSLVHLPKAKKLLVLH